MRNAYYGLIIGFVLIALMWTCMRSLFGSMCGNQTITEQLSPDKKFKFVVFVRDCGATTGFSTQVSILTNDRKLREDESGNVLILSDHYHGDYYNYFGGADVKAKWTANRKISIRFDSKAETGTKKSKVKGIEIVYESIR